MKKGFTLVELLIVVVIIGILATIAMPQYTKLAEKSKIAEARGILDQIRKAEEMIKAEQGSYSIANDDLDDYIANWPIATDSPLHYFTYGVALATDADDADISNTFVATATRKTSDSTGGKDSGWDTAYTITVDHTGTFTETNVP